MPSISVIVPVYQAEAYLQGCIDSVKSQTFTDWELILWKYQAGQAQTNAAVDPTEYRCYIKEDSHLYATAGADLPSQA